MISAAFRSCTRPTRVGGRIAFVACMLIFASPATAWAEDFALLIAAQDYAKGGLSGLRELKYSKNDIVDLKATLRNCGYKPGNIVTMTDGQPDVSMLPEYAKINTQLDLMLKDRNKNDTILVALAGHGVQFSMSRDNYFCPLDANLEEKQNLLALTDLYQRLDECSAARKMLLVDACRDDPLVSSSRGFDRVKLESVTRPQIDDVPEQTIAIFSCNDGQRSWEDDNLKHGVFFAQVLAGLRGEADRPTPDGRVTVEELADYVEKETRKYVSTHLKQLQQPKIKNRGGAEWVLRTLTPRAGASDNSLAAARELLNSGDHALARVAYDRMLRITPGNAKAFHGRGLAHLGLNNLDAAEADFREATRLDESSVPYWTSLGGVRGRAGKFDESAEAYTRALKLDPDFVAALVGRGAAYAELGRTDAALEDLNKALRAQPKHVDGLYNRALAYQKRGDAAAAQRDSDMAKSLENGR